MRKLLLLLMLVPTLCSAQNFVGKTAEDLVGMGMGFDYVDTNMLYTYSKDMTIVVIIKDGVAHAEEYQFKTKSAYKYMMDYVLSKYYLADMDEEGRLYVNLEDEDKFCFVEDKEDVVTFASIIYE